MRGTVRITLGVILILVQMLALIGNGGQAIVVPTDNYTAALVLYQLLGLLGYFSVGIVGTILLVSGLVARKRHSEDEIPREENMPKPPSESEPLVPRFCRACGASLIEDAVFCSQCGTQVASVPE